MIPLSLTDLVVVPKDAPWKSLGIRLTDQGHAILDRIKYKVFQVSSTLCLELTLRKYGQADIRGTHLSG